MKRLLRSSWVQATIAYVMGQYRSFALRTTRWRVVDEALFARLVNGQPIVLSFWHETVSLIPALRVVAGRRADYKALPIYALVSRHADGRFIGAVIRRLHVQSVWGSSSRGGASAFRSLLSLLSKGAIIALAPDGPRGPPHKAAAGVAMLPAMAGVPVMPCAVLITPRLRAGGWDRMIIPLPFGRGVIVFEEPIHVPRDGWEDALPQIEAATTAALRRAERLCGT